MTITVNARTGQRWDGMETLPAAGRPCSSPWWQHPHAGPCC